MRSAPRHARHSILFDSRPRTPGAAAPAARARAHGAADAARAPSPSSAAPEEVLLDERTWRFEAQNGRPAPADRKRKREDEPLAGTAGASSLARARRARAVNPARTRAARAGVHARVDAWQPPLSLAPIPPGMSPSAARARPAPHAASGPGSADGKPSQKRRR